MAVFRGFRAYRPCSELQGLIPALPYDVMSSAEAREMVKGNPYSFLHIDRAEIDLPVGTNSYDDAVYEKAKSNLLNLEKSGALVQDSEPCFYVYRQVMNGRSQTGIAGCASIDDYTNNVIKKHEHTLAKKEVDRIKHVEACNANTGPIFLTYRNRDEINRLVDKWTQEHSPVYDFVSDGVKQTVWIIDDHKIVESLSEMFKSVESMYIADGHHRCASAVKVGQEYRKKYPSYDGNEEFNFFLAIAFPDNQLEIMDYNRVCRDYNGYTLDELLKQIEKNFVVTKRQERFKPEKRHTFGMYTQGCWYELKAKDHIVNDCDTVKCLDVSIIQDYLFAPVLNITNPKNDDRIDFIGGIRGLEELERRADLDMKIAFAMYPTTVEELMRIADEGLIMPPKSTWFEPKLLSGLFIHHLT